MKYGLNDRPAPWPLLAYGLQWWVATLPSVVIMGLVVSRLHGADMAGQVFSLQKLFALMGAVTVIQVLRGHRLPLVVGPASTLLAGLVASGTASGEAAYTAIACGGALLALAAYSGLLSRLSSFFTPRIVAVILMLIAFALAPSILTLIFSGQNPAARLCFALAVVAFMVLLNVRLPGAAKSLTVFLGALVGWGVFGLFFGLSALPEISGDPGPLFLSAPVFNPGVLLSFFFCFLALTINELGSVESIGRMLEADDMHGRVRRGAGIQGLGNMAAGAMGIIGPVDYSMSAGLISATDCASRYTLIPAGLAMAACALFPKAILLLCAIPATVMGALMLYLMAAQLASGLGMLAKGGAVSNFTGCLTVGLPLMIGILIAFSPPEVFQSLPAALRPIAGNGFVMGTLAVLLMEHLVEHVGGNKKK